MAKTVRWQVPFASLNDTKYRVDIYDEGYTGSPVILQAGATPFTTEEDADNDIFAPVRTQTGTLQICTRLPDGTMLNVDDIMPANVLDRPIRLVNIASGKIEWQGFLSCEAYRYDYIGVPQIIELSAISVLEAMDNIEIEVSDTILYNMIINSILYVMDSIEKRSGVSLFSNLYVSAYCYDAVCKNYIFCNSYFRVDNYVNDEDILQEAHSYSCKEILAQIAKFFGCVWRESGNGLYLTAIKYRETVYWQSFTNWKNKYLYIPIGGGSVTMDTIGTGMQPLESQEWKGAGHQKGIEQGYKRVILQSKLDDFTLDLGLQECPKKTITKNPRSSDYGIGEIWANSNAGFYSMAEYKSYRISIVFPKDTQQKGSFSAYTGISGVQYGNTIFWKKNDFRTYYSELVGFPGTQTKYGTISYYLTSFMCYWRNSNSDLVSGLMVCGFPQKLYWSITPVQSARFQKPAIQKGNYVFKQSTPIPFCASMGALRLNIQTPAVWSAYKGYLNSEGLNWYNKEVKTPSLTVAVQFGNKYVKQENSLYSLVSEFTTFPLPFNQDGSTKGNGNQIYKSFYGVDPEENGIIIPIAQLTTGIVTLYIYPEIDAVMPDYQNQTTAACDMLITGISLEYLPLVIDTRNNRSENTYLINTGASFKDTLTVDVGLSSDNNNNKYATMIWDNSTKKPAAQLTLGSKTIRPEIDLLHRLKKQYSAVRTTLELEIAHPNRALPLLLFSGINDNKVYCPMAENRDWKMDSSKLTCIELGDR